MAPGESSGPLGTIAKLMAIFGGLIAVIRYFYPDPQDFMSALSGDTGGISAVIEPVGAVLSQAGAFFTGIGPLPSVALLFGSMILIGILNEMFLLDLEDIIPAEGPVAVLLLFLPFAVIWFWLFPVPIPGIEMGLFVVGYIVSGVLPTLAIFMLDI